MRKKITIGFIISVLWLVVCGWLFVCSVRAYQDTKQIKHRENEFLSTDIEVAVVETTTEGGANNGNEVSTPETLSLSWTLKDDTYTAVKEVQIKNRQVDNTNNVAAYIRVCIIPRWVATPKDELTSKSATFTADVSAYNSLVGDTSGSTSELANYKPFGELTDIQITNNTYVMGDVTFALADDWNTNWIYNAADGYFYYRDKVKPGDLTEKLLARVSVPKTVVESDENVHLQVDILADAFQTEGDALTTLHPDSGIIVGADGELTESTTETGN